MGELLETILNSSACPVTAEDIHGLVGTHASGGRAVRQFVVQGLVGMRVHMDVSTVRSTHGLVVHGLNFLWLIGSCG